MNILSNICNPKEQHFDQETKTQTYKPLSDYIFQNKTMQKMRARYEKEQNCQQFKYQSWNHPYSISNYFMHQSPSNGKHHVQQQSSYIQGQNSGYVGNEASWRNDGNPNKKISFKDVNQIFCAANKEEELGERQFKDRDQFYATMKGVYPNYNTRTQVQQDTIEQPSVLQQERENLNITAQSYSHSLLGKEIIQLKQQNKELKRVIEQQYKPMKELYNKLLAEQQEREYLISKLEWKVKELVKELGNNNNSINSAVYQLMSNQTNKNTKQVPKSHVHTQKKYALQYPNGQQPQTILNNHSSYQPNLMDRNTSQIAFQQHQSHNLTNISTYFPLKQVNANYQQTQSKNYFPQEHQNNQNNISKPSYFLDNSYQSKHIPFPNHLQTVNFQNNQFLIPNPNPQSSYYQNIPETSNLQVKKIS